MDKLRVFNDSAEEIDLSILDDELGVVFDKRFYLRKVLNRAKLGQLISIAGKVIHESEIAIQKNAVCVEIIVC